MESNLPTLNQSIAIITGWTGSERAISLRSAEAVRRALASSWWEAAVYDFPRDLQKFLSVVRPAFAFVIVHGKDGEDGKIPAMLELLGIPYQWADFSVHALCIDKIRTKAVWKSAGIPVAKDCVITAFGRSKEAFAAEIASSVGFPAVVKVPTEWSSNGVYIVWSSMDLDGVWPELSDRSDPLLIEEYVSGREVTVSVLEPADGSTIVLPIIEIIPPEGQEFDYENKYNGKTKEVCPAEIPAGLADKISTICLEAYRALGVRGYGRIDAIVRSDGDVRLLELNTIPGFTDQSLFPLATRTHGLSFPELLDILMKTGIRNFQARR